MNFNVLDSNTIDWRPSTYKEGIWVKDLGNSDGYSIQMVRFEKGASFPSHHHPKAEFIYILEGELIQNDKNMSKGFVSISDPLTVDISVDSPSGCMFLLISAV